LDIKIEKNFRIQLPDELLNLINLKKGMIVECCCLDNDDGFIIKKL